MLEAQVKVPHAAPKDGDLNHDTVAFLFVFLQALVEFFGTLSKEWALDCMKELLQVNMRGNLQIIVQVRVVGQQVRMRFKNRMMSISVAVLASLSRCPSDLYLL